MIPTESTKADSDDAQFCAGYARGAEDRLGDKARSVDRLTTGLEVDFKVGYALGFTWADALDWSPRLRRCFDANA